MFLAAGLWILLNPARAAGSMARPIAGVGDGTRGDGARRVRVRRVCICGATGETFWGPYLQRQLSPVTIATPFTARRRGSAISLLSQPAAVASRAVESRAGGRRVQRRRARGAWRRLRSARRGVTFVLGFVAIVDRVPHAVEPVRRTLCVFRLVRRGGVGVVVASRPGRASRPASPGWTSRSRPLPALAWLTLVLLRLALGPLLSRVRIDVGGHCTKFT